MIDRVYDGLMGALERAAIRDWRSDLWRYLPPSGRGLEIGAGTGANREFYPPSAPVVATELRPAMLAGAVRKGLRPIDRVLAADVQALPFRDATFDWAVATLVFCEVPDPLLGLREVRRVLRPGGMLALLEHVRPDGVLGDVARLITRVTGPLLGEHYDRETLATVRRAEFIVERERRAWKGALALVVGRAPRAG